MKKLSMLLYNFIFILCFMGVANATLWDRGNGLIYDDVLDVTWLQDARYFKSELSDARIDEIILAVESIDGHDLTTYDFEGYGTGDYERMTWYGAMAWVDQLEFAGYNDWRLPYSIEGELEYSEDGTRAFCYNNTSSEMGYMYYVNLNNQAYYGTDVNNGANATFTDGNNNIISFINLVDHCFWSSTTYSLNPSLAWGFHFANGMQGTIWNKESFHVHAWAVRDGDVAPIPEPATIFLLVFGLAGLVGFRSKMKNLWRSDGRALRP